MWCFPPCFLLCKAGIVNSAHREISMKKKFKYLINLKKITTIWEILLSRQTTLLCVLRTLDGGIHAKILLLDILLFGLSLKARVDSSCSLLYICYLIHANCSEHKWMKEWMNVWNHINLGQDFLSMFLDPLPSESSELFLYNKHILCTRHYSNSFS